MADDIDIEEHDVLDNPVIKNIFPDITVIKNEILQYYDVENIKQEPEITTSIINEKYEEPTIYTEADKSIIHVHEQSSSNKHAAISIMDNSECNYNELKNRSSFQGSKIILGSKPNKTVENTEVGEIKVNKGQNISLESFVRIPTILVQDLGEYIYQSNRYCEDCKILFPRRSDLNDHKLKLHTIKTQIKPTIVKVTPKKAFVNTNNKCNICGTCFSSKGNLSKHYRNVHKKITTKNNMIDALHIASVNHTKTKRTQNKCDLIERKSNDITLRKKNKNSNVKVTLDKAEFNMKVNKPLHRKQIKQNSSLNENKCTICGSCFSCRPNLNRHYKNVHKMAPLKAKHINANSLHNNMEPINIETRLPNKNATSDAKNVCFHCNEQFFDQKCLIEHMYKILEPKQKPNPKCNRIVTLAEEKSRLTPNTNIKESSTSTKTEEIRMKDKLTFESHSDSDESELPSSDEEKIKKRDLHTKMNRKKDHAISKTLENDQTKCNANDKNQDQHSSKLLINKRKRDSCDEEASLKKWRFQDTYEKKEKRISQSNSFKKKKTLGSENINSSRTTSKNVDRNAKINISNKIKTSETKRARSKTALPTTMTKNKNRRVELQPNNKRKNMFKGLFVYECIYCSYIFPTPRAYNMHMFCKHKLTKMYRVNKVIFDRQCKYCPYMTTNQNRNKHIRISHYDLLTKSHKDKTEGGHLKKKRTILANPAFKKVESFALKSIVYNCIKCDIHFLSSCIAKDHEKHMELLINWKCSLCRKIFKKHDKVLHLKQHTFSKTVSVCQFDQAELSRLLYNCTKCAIHFTEERYLEHYLKCGIQLTDSTYCNKCDILIDKCGYAIHETHHRTNNITADIIVITGDIITNNQNEPTSLENSSNLNEPNTNKTSKKNINCHKYKKDVRTVKKKVTYCRPINCLTFCQTCKCYLTDMAMNRKSHVEGLCSKMVTYTCPTCGLVFTNKTINTHRDHHKMTKGLNLQDFVFFDLHGIRIRPPIPEYPACNNCDVIFVGRNAAKSHVCGEVEYLTCEVCDIKLSENAFKLHMNFHNYMFNEKVDQLLYAAPRESEQHNIAPKEKAHVLNQRSCTALLKTDKPEAIDIQIESQEHNAKVDKAIATSSLLLCNGGSLKENKNDLQSIEATESPRQKQNPSTLLEGEHKDPTDNSPKTNVILYACQACKVSVDTYEKVVQHCQNHFSPNPMIPSYANCSQCSLKFEKETYDTHQKLHFDGDIIQILAFDPTYFTADNDIWIRHIFASVTLSIQKEAIEKSIYRHECRIKMEVIQQGPPYLTVYKCNKCGIFIDPDCLISHVTDGCPRNGKHPCSVCGLPFHPKLYRNKHEKIHRQHNNVRLKSYNIILINCETHKSYNASILNAMKQYVLHQCRTCDVIVESVNRYDHTCNIDGLRKCPTCGLILYNDDFKSHIAKHSDLTLYNTANIKVILFGNQDEPITNKILSSTFNGVVSDFKLYKCIKCEECENNDKLMLRHVCTFDDSKWKCPKCGYFISAQSIKQHIKLHDVEVEFKAQNFTFVNFGSTKDKDKSLNGTKESHCADDSNNSNKRGSNCKADDAVTGFGKNCVETQLDHVTASDNENSANNDQDKESVALYKCACGLHYMDETNAKNHTKHCNPKIKIMKQNCSKCSLTFNPKELFAHILAHHADKHKTFKYYIKEINTKL